ncbi:MAG: S8 family serine peptidase [Deltaproteobacteria bacterium]|nr:S8 family serine peptidase [Deltaproteobacteria bacterium]
MQLIESGAHVAADSAGALNAEEVVVEYDPNDDFCAKLLASGEASSCSPDFEIRALATPNDPSYPSLWGMNATSGIDAPSAWDISTGSQEVIVAVVDTGVDYSHPDLADNMWFNTGEVSGNGIDDDGNGYIDDVYGWNAVSNNGNPMDDNGHGTHCAGTIGGRGNNGIGVAGVNWSVKIMALKFLNANGSGSLSGAVSVLNYMNTMKQRGVNIRVSSNSWGGGGFSQSLYNAIAKARDLGIIFVAAAGNESNDNDASPSYPAGYELSNVVSVAALDQQRNAASFSNYGANTVDIAAPGVGILSTYPGNRYASLSGTSMATPHVSGALALLLASEAGLTADQAMERLYATGLPLSTLTGVVRTGRMLNAGRLLRNESNPLPAPTPAPTPCNYAISAVPFTPDSTAPSSTAVINADELSYYQVDLPFTFPYFGRDVSQIFVSPNGVVYTNGAPSGMDYLNGANAPLNSIAALHADLTTQDSPNAVRVKLETNRVTIFWQADAYGIKGQGAALVWLTINSDGTIDDFISFETSATMDYLQSRSTIGITGQQSSHTYTYAYNASKLQNGFAIRYTPLCTGDPNNGGDSGAVSKIELYGKNSKGRLSRRASSGKKVQISLNGTGNGTVEVSAAFNNRTCPTSGAASLQNGSAQLEAVLPRVPDQFSSFKVRSGAAKKSISIAHNKARSRHRSKRISSKRLQTLCEKLFSSLSSI